MKKQILITLLTIIAVSGCFFQTAGHPGDTEKSSALRQWQSIYDKTAMHKGALIEVKGIIRRGETNFEDLVRISKMISEIPYHTELLIRVAEKAAHAKNPRIDFIKLAELSILKLSESDTVLDLIDYAGKIGADDDLNSYNRQFDYLMSTADASTIDEAVAMVNEIIRQAKASASNL